ncbi:hypothetical protein V6Z11_D12G221900 [Gossypium hirsutum]
MSITLTQFKIPKLHTQTPLNRDPVQSWPKTETKSETLASSSHRAAAVAQARLFPVRASPGWPCTCNSTNKETSSKKKGTNSKMEAKNYFPFFISIFQFRFDYKSQLKSVKSERNTK